MTAVAAKPDTTPVPHADIASLHGHMPTLDGFRGIAVLMVLAYHFGGWTADSFAGGWMSRIVGAGWIGVDLFFVLSGFLITGILWDAKESPHYFRNFYARRILRIFPLYYGVLALIFVLLPLANAAGILHLDHIKGTIHAHLSGDLRDLQSQQIYFWTYTANIYATFFHPRFYDLNHFWSLCVEEHFYLLWPAIVLAASRRNFLRLGLGLVAGCLLARILLRLWFPSVNVYIFTLTRMDSLAVGGLLAVYLRGPNPLARCLPAARILLALCTLLLLAQCLRAGTLHNTDFIVQTLGFSVLAVFFACALLLSIAAPARSWSHKTLTFAPLRSIGKYSYGMYVFHRLAIFLFVRSYPRHKLVALLHSPFLVNLLGLCGFVLFTFVIAYISWHLYEKHFLKLKRHFKLTRITPAALTSR